MVGFSEIQSDYHGFLPGDTDGNAKLKSEFVRSKPKNHSKKENKQCSDEAVEPDTAENAVESTIKHGGKKHRGQNKHRPRPEREDLSLRLCPSMVTKHGTCSFGDGCKFMHDVDAYMKSKPEDLGSSCYAFRTYGVCQYSFACRYAQDHIKKVEGQGYVNTIATDEQFKSEPVLGNLLSRELRLSLRKRKFDFDDADRAVKRLQTMRQNDAGGGGEAPCKIDGDGNGGARAAFRLESNVAVETVSADGAVCGMAEIGSKVKEESANGTVNAKANVKRVPSECEVVVTPQVGAVLDADMIPLRGSEKRTVDFRGKLYLAPLTTCGNLPFRVVCKRQGADITCGEMAVATNLLQGNPSEWALLRKHPCEDLFGVQLCGAFPDTMTRCAHLINKSCAVDFVDINMGCPIDLIYKKGAGSALMRRTHKLFDIVRCMESVLDVPLTCKMRTGVETKRNTAHTVLPGLRDLGVSLATIHGRSREARYTKVADWMYVDRCAKLVQPMPVFGNGDVLTQQDYWSVVDNSSLSGVMIARGALIKPWIFTEIKERRDWDISSHERMAILRNFCDEGLVHWGSDTKGVESTRRFLLEWLSFLHRYIPIGLMEQTPQRINERPAPYVGRDELETLFASSNCSDWVKISEMLLGKVPDKFNFLPKHKANSYN